MKGVGAINLASFNAVLPFSIADAPELAVNLVYVSLNGILCFYSLLFEICAYRITTVAGIDCEVMVHWAIPSHSCGTQLTSFDQ